MSRNCNACAHSRSAEISKAAAAGVSFREISTRYQITVSAAQRHAVRCLRLVRSAEKRGQGDERINAPDSSRFENGRCPTCSQLTGEGDQAMTSADIVRRAERILFVSEGIAAQAQAGDDSRLALQAVDRCQRSVDTLAKIAGLIKTDGPTVVVNSEELTLKKAFSLVVNAIDGGERRQAEFARICTAFFEGQAYELPITIDAAETGTQAALNAAS